MTLKYKQKIESAAAKLNNQHNEDHEGTQKNNKSKEEIRSTIESNYKEGVTADDLIKKNIEDFKTTNIYNNYKK